MLGININNYVRTSKKTQPLTITKTNWLMLLKEIKVVYSGNRIKSIPHLWENLSSCWLLKQTSKGDCKGVILVQYPGSNCTFRLRHYLWGGIERAWYVIQRHGRQRIWGSALSRCSFISYPAALLVDYFWRTSNAQIRLYYWNSLWILQFVCTLNLNWLLVFASGIHHNRNFTEGISEKKI